MRVFAIVLNALMFLLAIYLMSHGGFPNQPRDILLQFLLVITPVVSIIALLVVRKPEKWMMK